MDKQNNCEGCQALWYCWAVECGCLLNYLNKKLEGKYIPLESCPKPLTKKEFELTARLATPPADLTPDASGVGRQLDKSIGMLDVSPMRGISSRKVGRLDKGSV